ncbi:hypothetical protein P691DRAFT_792462 [Macrolepiota fuliginosa MF-IS2]|uniref:Uncharacterized protein n=1 Tax=Macrolepiota fuliginosa MF-IS2 TaxID=1400762 RepID=A0A9P5WY28_9AGAR|nr:hypothetical protein P691DRAFT_792462 [Macrolepiota fuliginosa MF-IS2]
MEITDILNGNVQVDISHEGSNPPNGPLADGPKLEVIDVFGIVASLIEHSLMPCVPFFPMVAVTMWVLELFYTSYLCCPHLSIQSFVKGLADLHNVPYGLQLLKHFTICYNLLCNACPACTYKLEGEDALNDSLKQILCKEVPTLDNTGEAAPRPISVETLDPRKVYETGIFLALCCHGFVLVVADMICSGELVKYPLAVVKALLNTFSGSCIGGGYNIGCQFQVMLSHSGLKDHVLEDHYMPLIGSFHGHAHNHLCQLSYLATYKILDFMKHMDATETSQNLSQFLVSNYKQALNILVGRDELLQRMKIHRVEDPWIFKKWLEEERTYLQSLSQEPEPDVLKMEYYQWLVNLANSLDLEQQLNIMVHWTPAMPKWQQTVVLVSECHYCKRLDQLELLVVSQLSKLSKMNMSQTSYKMQKHISKALQQCLCAIQTALTCYNEAAQAMVPKCPQLTWEQVLDYTFLVDFDLLCGSQGDVRAHPWANQTTCLYMDSCQDCSLLSNMHKHLADDESDGEGDPEQEEGELHKRYSALAALSYD